MLSDLSDLLEALDRFLEVAAQANKARIIAPHEKKIKEIMRDYFLKQGRLFAAEHAKYENAYPLEEAITLDELKRLLAAAGGGDEPPGGFKEALAAIMSQASQYLLDVIDTGDIVGVAFDLKNPAAVAFLDAHAAELVTGISTETENVLRALLTKAGEEGWSYNRTAGAIRSEVFEVFSRSRAQTIAVTESRFAYERANLETGRSLKEMGLDMVKSFLAEGDACEECEENAGEDWIEIDADFPNGDPPVHPNCRCDLLIQRRGAGE